MPCGQIVGGVAPLDQNAPFTAFEHLQLDLFLVVAWTGPDGEQDCSPAGQDPRPAMADFSLLLVQLGERLRGATSSGNSPEARKTTACKEDGVVRRPGPTPSACSVTDGQGGASCDGNFFQL